MNKIFLSHSSVDKNYVRPIAKYFGNDRCVFDEVAFESGMQTIEEIFSSIDKSDLFVYFISESALNSEWVKKEINQAQEKLHDDKHKLSQIYPIIIDDSIQHSDSRIPSFLRTGMSAYNLRHIKNYKIACKKIESQLTLLTMRQNEVFSQKYDFFYGRDLEKKAFKDCFEERTIEGKIKHIKCLVVSGIDGIGRKSYVRGTLKDSGLMDKHYFPSTISLEKSEGIEDLIIKVSDLGFGAYSISDLQTLNALEDKIKILVDLLMTVQQYLEHIIVEDHFCLIDETGSLKYWFEKALEQINNQITISVISNISLDAFHYRRHPYIFQYSLEELGTSDSIGFLRTYSKLNDVPFGENDLDAVASVLTGYPPQVVYCVDLAKEKSIKSVTNNQYMISEMPNISSGKMIELVIEPKQREKYFGFLAFLAKFGSTPIGLVNQVLKENNDYKFILAKLKKFTICNHTGATGEYIKLSAVIRDYVQRMNYELTDDIKTILSERIVQFHKEMQDPEYVDFLDFSELTYLIKENLKQGKTIPDRFLYSTLYVQTVLDLYNERQYNKVIEFVESLKSRSGFTYLQEEIQKNIQFYYCSALARKKSMKFDAEVDFFRADKEYDRYNFLKGFNARLNGHYVRAERYLTNVLRRNFKHHNARRELVIVYTSTQNYDSALELAKINYHRSPENTYHVQAYFDCMIRQPKSKLDNKAIEDMLTTARAIQRNKPTEIYYQLEAKVAAFLENDKDKSINFLSEGLQQFTKSFYLSRDKFDICKHFGDVKGMEESFSLLKHFVQNGYDDQKITVFFRECYLAAYRGNAYSVLKLKIESNQDLPDASKLILLSNIEKIYTVSR
ncbi:toll/interleukin-1 receptor domain-containing protein [Paenibacillus sp. sptzw28]|uniref:toll/interleukin-1 receptor domain-containing protein n=1 Tax=Paenibacillus sp. sptzw28 TaxID=715179 RepID=UPI001C6F11B9|nr:toll/interleukin-1 receptor domain-containing protein [Paenibacillus sp. sptzw28]QYR21104.1 toll/interleukin-1 receptor domain-containing protein [Paenibacillus sp. sptzw28]